ncbi:MAG: TonB-dependent receptor, partial [Gemmatimonadaceae bacterium]|nr:TonB-dependent receptor [Chitinophagaceae bacterium]
YDFKIDSFTSIKISINGSRTEAKSSTFYLAESLTEEGRPVNGSERLLNSEGIKQNFSSTILLRKRFKKVGRTISFNFDPSYMENKTDGFLRSENEFYNASGAVFRRDSVDQQKQNSLSGTALVTKFAYTEPLSKKIFLELNYSYRLSNNEAFRNSFNKGTNGKYEVRDSVFSNDYKFRFNTNSAGASIKINGKKAVFSAGGNVGFSDFKQTDLRKDSTYKYSYVNLFPKASIRYNFGPQRRISLNYNGNTRQPTLEQIQPIRENSDPLNIQEGNKDLKQEFRHSFSMNFNDYKVLTSRNLYLSTNFSFTQNAISNSTVVDSVGARISRFVNVSGNYNGGLWGGYWAQIKKWNLNLGLNVGMNVSKYKNFVNGLENVNDNTSGNVSVSFSKNKENKYEIYVRPGISYNWSKSSLRKDIKTNYWSSQSEGGFTFYLPWKLELNSEAEINLREKTALFDRNVNSVKLNSYLAKKFMKGNAGEVRFSIFDMLNQNIGLERNANSNFISENRYNTVQRYWLLSFTWSFNHNAAGSIPK